MLTLTDWLTGCLYYDIWQTADEITVRVYINVIGNYNNGISHRYLHWRPLDVSWRRNCSLEVFRTSTALPTIASDRYSVLTSRRTRVLSLSLAFVRCPCSLSFDITPPKSFLSIIIIIIITATTPCSKKIDGQRHFCFCCT